MEQTPAYPTSQQQVLTYHSPTKPKSTEAYLIVDKEEGKCFTDGGIKHCHDIKLPMTMFCSERNL